MCIRMMLCVCVYAVNQGGVRLLYIAITLLFLLMTVIAEMMVGGGCGSGGGVAAEDGGTVREAERCSVRRVRPDS